MKVKIPEARYLELLNKERLLQATQAVQHKHCEEYKVDAERWRQVQQYADLSDSKNVPVVIEAVLKDAELGALVRRMPLNSTLFRGTSFLSRDHQNHDMWRFTTQMKDVDAIAPTPEEALRGISREPS